MTDDKDAQIAVLREALQAFHDDAAAAAISSFRTWNQGAWHWDDRIWKENDPDGFALAEQARRALSTTPKDAAKQFRAEIGSEIEADIRADERIKVLEEVAKLAEKFVPPLAHAKQIRALKDQL